MAHVVVVVLGDLGRSPRMQYHAQSLSLLQDIERVTLIGYEGEKLIIPHQKKIIECRINPSPSLPISIPIISTIYKGLVLLFSILKILWSLPSYDLILIQNPPCLPVVLASIIISILKNKTFILIDWHNLGFAMFEEKLGKHHALVLLSKLLERFLVVGFSDGHICVSKALSQWLRENFGATSKVVYDRPAKIFQNKELSLTEKHNLFMRLGLTDECLFADLINCNDGIIGGSESSKGSGISLSSKSKSKSIQTAVHSNNDNDNDNDKIFLREDYAPILVSSTSWTPDEDFNLLLDALVAIDAQLSAAPWPSKGIDKIKSDALLPPRFVTLITGKGPMKQKFEDEVSRLKGAGKLKRIAVKTLWLEPQDYPLLLSCADLGVCLHTSTSGLDLPMKVVDMFGSGVPVLAVRFPTLPELVKDGVNGRIFSTSDELTQQIISLLFPFVHGQGCDAALEFDQSKSPSESLSLRKLKEGAKQLSTWDENWQLTMFPLVTDSLKRSQKNKSKSKSLVLMFSFSILLISLFFYAQK